VLKYYLGLFEADPAERLMSARGAEYMADLAALGTLTAPKRTRRVRCRVCAYQGPRQITEIEEFVLRCQACGGDVEWQGSPYQSVRMRHQWLPEALNAQLGGDAHEPVEILKNRVWRLVDVESSRGPVPVVLVRCGWSADYQQISAAIRRITRHRVLVLTTAREPDKIEGPQRWVVPLTSIATLDAQGLWVDRERLAERYLRGHAATRKIAGQPSAPPAADGLWFELAPDRSWLRVKDRVLRLSGKQRAFVASIAQAHKRKHSHKHFSDALTEAGYEGHIRSLQQISTRPEFREFIGMANGLVWIRNDME